MAWFSNWERRTACPAQPDFIAHADELISIAADLPRRDSPCDPRAGGWGGFRQTPRTAGRPRVNCTANLHRRRRTTSRGNGIQKVRGSIPSVYRRCCGMAARRSHIL